MLGRKDLPRGWRPVPMINNVERADPWEGVDGADALRAAREQRRLTALDDGTAWRDRDQRLLVVRCEVFADAHEDEHRAVWIADAERVLASAWRVRWTERGQSPGWIEARRRLLAEGDAPLHRRVDWYEVEDHTDPTARGDVTIYHHLTVWAGRMHVVVTVRHPLGDPPADLDHLAGVVAERAASRLG
ncbi:MAG: hypothetical protein JWN46_2591 [Acidimicrobiales bacterium]|nr:hypothetical protein [Acidimicrobiales bacterium]